MKPFLTRVVLCSTAGGYRVVCSKCGDFKDFTSIAHAKARANCACGRCSAGSARSKGKMKGKKIGAHAFKHLQASMSGVDLSPLREEV